MIHKEFEEFILQRNRITFAEFMNMALYHARLGYYISRRERIGRAGDYYTSSDVNKAFGECVMRQIDEMMHCMNEREINVIEAGAGKGLLCLDIMLSAREKSPPLYDAIRYIIVEKSPDFKNRQKALAEKSGISEKIQWVDAIDDALSDGTGIVLSNELIDAFPVHRVIFSGDRWQEIYVTIKDGITEEIVSDLSDSRLKDFLMKLEVPFSDGYTTEVNLDGLDWIREVGNRLEKGFVITIDYGYPRIQYYSPERNRGTLMCYKDHSSNNNPYMNVGEQDITAHVDFTSFAESGLLSGLHVTGFTEQSYFLLGCGIDEAFKEINRLSGDGLKAYSENITLKKLIMPGGMGSMFKVLVQHKGLEKPSLRGFSFKDISRSL